MTTRACGGCTACCKIMPVAEIKKPALERCPHQRTGKGCAIYERRPGSCRHWVCAWLVAPEEMRDLARPDRSGYVIDILPDFVTLRDDNTGETTDWPVIQIWTSPNRPNAHRDPALRAYLEQTGRMALVRTGSTDAFLLSPPSTNAEGRWIEAITKAEPVREHTAAEIADVLRRARA